MIHLIFLFLMLLSALLSEARYYKKISFQVTLTLGMLAVITCIAEHIGGMI